MKNRITEWLRKYIITITLVVGGAFCAFFLIWMGHQPTTTDIFEDMDCQVVQFEIGFEKICTIECAWSQGNEGYATSTPVSCGFPPALVTRTVMAESVNRTVLGNK